MTIDEADDNLTSHGLVLLVLAVLGQRVFVRLGHLLPNYPAHISTEQHEFKSPVWGLVEGFRRCGLEAGYFRQHHGPGRGLGAVASRLPTGDEMVVQGLGSLHRVQTCLE